MEAVRTLTMKLVSGDILTLEVSQDLVNQVREAYNLESDNDVTEMHFKGYLVSSMNRALAGEESDGR